MQSVSYDPGGASLRVQMDDKQVTIRGVSGDTAFTRSAPNLADDLAIWISRERADVLVKMIEYILGRVKISEASRTALEAMLPEFRRVARAGDQTANPPEDQPQAQP